MDDKVRHELNSSFLPWSKTLLQYELIEFTDGNSNDVINTKTETVN